MKRLPFYLSITLFIILLTPASASARTFSIDEASIRAWIMPSGDLVVNEVFSYTFEGEYSRVIRSLPWDNAWTVSDFEAYELLNPEAEPGFVKMEEIRPLSVKSEENNYHADFPVKDAESTFFFTYIMKNAVSSYDTYSDLTLPFFGTDRNHDADIHNVTIDLVFPGRLDPDQYHAFFRGDNGKIEVKNEELVRFSLPVSKARELAEVRVLFPSAIMADQAKTAAPMSLDEALAEETKIPGGAAPRSPAEEEIGLSPFFRVLAAACLLASVFFLLLPQRRLRAPGTPERLLSEDPLYLYVADRAGKKDFHALFAGLYSLVHQGKAQMEAEEAQIRLRRDPGAPDRTLAFILKPDGLKECEEKLADWLFRRRLKLGRRYFSLNKLYGTTELERKDRDIRKYRNNQIDYYRKEHDWFTLVIERMKEEGVLSSRLHSILSAVLSITIFLSVILFLGSKDAEGGRLILYLGASLALLWKNLRGKSRLRIFLFFLASSIAVDSLDDNHFILIGSLVAFIAAAALLYALVPRYLLSKEAAGTRADIRRFRKLLNTEGIPESVTAGELDKWLIRATILNVKWFKLDTDPLEKDERLAAVAPLSFLVLNGEEPAKYMIQTWKWSKPADTPFWDTSSGQNTSSSDGGGGWSGSTGGDGGGGDGGGAGAD